MLIIADMHTHTVASGHAYSTVNEMARAARDRGLKALALTDHGPALPGGPHLYHFGAMRFIPDWIDGVRILRGVEANIIGPDGTLDMPDTYLAKLDFAMAGLHENCGFDGHGVDRNTEAVLLAMANPRIKAISHSGNPAFPVHFEELARGALETGTALEINNSSFVMSRKGSRANCEMLAGLLARYGAPVIVGSDAHIAQGVGEFDAAVAVLEKAGVRPEQVVNSSFERLMDFLGLEHDAQD
ncbi:MAG TPA: phosphatase [Geobacteraceae bacterium]|nr:phosphatase [Geobacteraceae bacterium]